jgi:hypothetical protein
MSWCSTKPTPKEQVANTLLGMTFTLSFNKVRKDCQEVNTQEPSQGERDIVNLKLLKDVRRQGRARHKTAMGKDNV